MRKSEIAQLTQKQLAELSPTEYEQISEQGLEYRQALSDRVLSFLIIPDGWNALIEYGSEYGGNYPVTIEYLPKVCTSEIALYVSSCGEENPQWEIVMMVENGRDEWLYNADKFDPDSISAIIQEISAQWALRLWGSMSEIDEGRV